MRLLTVGSLPPELGGPVRGGVATFHAALLEGLSRRADEVEVVGVMPPSPLRQEVPFPVFARPDDVGIARFYEDLLVRVEPDVVLMNHVANTVGVTHARLAGPPPAAGIVHSWHNILFRSGEERQRAHAVTAEALGGLAAVVCPSHHSLHEGQQLGLPNLSAVERIHYPLQPVYTEDTIEVDAAERHGVLFVGSLIERKRPASLVEAAALLPAVEMTLVGEGEQEASLRERIKSHGLSGRVRLTDLPGPMRPQRLRDTYLSSRALCLPSSSESFGIVFIEALACGTPVVGFGPTVREIRDEMGVEIGEPLDDPSPTAIAAALERTMAAEWDREELRRAAVSAFDLDRVTNRYLELLARLASPTPTPPQQ